VDVGERDRARGPPVPAVGDQAAPLVSLQLEAGDLYVHAEHRGGGRDVYLVLKHLAGYRDTLDYLDQNDPCDPSVGLVLHLHRLLFGRTGGGGGQFKTVDNLVVDRHSDGTSSVRFVPTSHRDMPFFTSELVNRYCIEQGAGRHHRVLLVGLFALDFLTVHPFIDGNGRLARLLSTRLLSQVGYGVGRYVSLEGVIYERRDAYYDALAASTAGWQDGSHNPWPWLSFFVDVVADAYEVFAARVADHRSRTRALLAPAVLAGGRNGYESTNSTITLGRGNSGL
jgi:Fic family protein